MFLKLRKLRPALLLPLSLVLFLVGLFCLEGAAAGRAPSPHANATTAMPDAPAASPTEAAPTLVPPTEAASGEPWTTASFPAPSTEAPGSGSLTGLPPAPEESAPETGLRRTLLAVGALLFFGLSLFFAVLFVGFRREKSLAGPEGALGLLCAAVPFALAGREASLFFVPALFCLLSGLAAGLAWLKNGEKWEGLLSRRLSRAVSQREGGRLGFLSVFSAVSLLAGAAWAIFFPSSFAVVLPPAAFFLALGVSGVAFCLRAGRALSSLETQIAALHEGETAEPVPGVFGASSQALSDLGKTVTEAVNRAVRDERFKVELISNVSHDLRTPLTAVVGNAELLKTEPLTDAGRGRLEALIAKTDYMRSLVDDLFELTKVSSGQIVPETSELDLVRLIEQSLALHADALEEKGLALRASLPESLPLVTDGARLHRVFDNLILNAVKYGMPGTRFFVRLTTEGDEAVARFSNVSETELDFSPEEITERFARGDKTRSTAGSGLGLAIAKTYTEALGGSFAVELDGDVFTAVVSVPITEK